jgi:hypothetical protein
LGVKVYVVIPSVAVLIVAGLHVPEIPLFELTGNKGGAAFRQSGPIGVKAGVMAGLTVIVNVVMKAHWPASGVKVYVVVVVLSRAGVHVPVMPLFDIVGRVASEAPEHIGATALKVGVILAFTVIVNVVVTAHWPASGVNV